MKPIDNEPYVYYHLDDHEVVYIGHGTNDRVTFIWNRQPDHRAWMESQNPLHYRIVPCKSVEDSIKFEKEEIQNYKPKFNKHYTGRLTNAQEEQILGAIDARIASGINAEVCSERVKELNALRVKCPNCGQEGGRTAMVRWHSADGSKCKYPKDSRIGYSNKQYK